MPTLDEQCRTALAGPADRPAIEFAGRWVTWGEVRTVADSVANLLTAAGVPVDAPIAFVPRNRPSALAAELGMIAARYTISMVYAFQSAEGIARDVGLIEAGAVVAAVEDFTPELLEAAKARGLVAIALKEMSAAPIGDIDRCARAPSKDAAYQPEIRVHTSGTTGAPKHVGFSYETISTHIVGENMSRVIEAPGASSPSLMFYPLGNISGIYSGLPPLLQGKTIQMLDRFNLDEWRDHVRRYRPAMASVPAGGIRMILDADIPVEELSSLKFMPTGAAPLDPTVQKAFEDRYGVPILLSYGATEFGGPVTLMSPQDYSDFGAAKLGSVGRPFAGASLKVVDAETGAELPAGESGILEVIAPRIGDHWIRTTDVGMLDADGFLWLRGRADGAIMRGGFKLLPDVIERALCLHPAIAAVSVVGLPEPRLGQIPVAAIQLKPGQAEPTIGALEDHVRQHVYATHVPVKWRFVEALPRNGSFKIDLAGVRQLFSAA